MFNDEEDESFESSTDSGSDSEPEVKGSAKNDSDGDDGIKPVFLSTSTTPPSMFHSFVLDFPWFLREPS